MALLQGLNARLGASQLRSTSSSTKAAPVPLLAPRPASGLLLPQHIEPRSVRHLLQTQAAVVDEAPVSSFSSLLDDDVESDEGELLYSQVPDPEAEVDESLLVTNLGVSDETVNALSKRGIHALFPVQKQVFEPIASGRDVVCRAKTGSGKTLAFALPVVESLLEENAEQRPRKGRAPRAIVLAPTRELANQVAREFASICPTIVVDSFYGGTSIGAQMRSLERGVDVMVGTPGRVIDLIERKALQLDQVRFAILDEADQMLDMGFEQDMETILGVVPAKRQTLLFSATLPKWVSKVSRKFQDNPLTIDLVGEENTGKLADTITLLLQQVEGSQKMNALQDLITTYATGGKSIIFVNTKARADEVAITLGEYMGCEALHGDIGQAQREKALQAFRDGKVSALVATDVAARGLDIPAVDLVVHYDVPQDNEAFLHRSGRTGRAGSRGTAVVLFTERETRTLGFILRDTKVTNAELIGAADPAEVMTQASRSVLNKMDKVDARVVDFFQPAAEKLLASEQPSRVLAAALASMAGFSRVPQPRSLLTYETGYVTLRLLAKPGAVDGVASLKMALKKLGTKAKVARPAGLDLESPSSLGKIRVVEDAASGLGGCAFDVPSDAAEVMLEVFAPAAQAMGMQLDRPRSIALDVDDMLGGSRGGGGGGGRFGRGGGGGDRFGRGGGGDRFGSRRDGGGRDDRFGGRDRDGGFRGGRDSRGGDRGGWGGRDGGRDGGRSRDGGGWDRYSASSYDDYNGGGGRGGGGRDRDGGWGRRDGGASSRNGGGNSSRYAAAAAPAAPTWAQVSADADTDYFANDVAPAESNGNGKGAKKLTPRGGSKRSSDPAPIDDWGKW